MQPVLFTPPPSQPNGDLSPSGLSSSEHKVQDAARPQLGFFADLGRRAGKWKDKRLLGMAQALYSSDLRKAEADAQLFLQKHIADLDLFENKLAEELDGIIAFLISKGVPLSKTEIGAQGPTDRRRLLLQLFRIIAGNLAKQVIAEADGQITCAELTSRSLRYLLHFFGDTFNHAEEGQNIDQTTQELFEKILPLDGVFINQAKPYIVKGIKAVFDQIHQFMDKDPLEAFILNPPVEAKEPEYIPSTPQERAALERFQRMTKNLGGFVLDAVSGENLKRDEEALVLKTKKPLEEVRGQTVPLAKELAALFTPSLLGIQQDQIEVTQERVERALLALLTHLWKNGASLEKLKGVIENDEPLLPILLGGENSPFKAILERHPQFFLSHFQKAVTASRTFLDEAPQEINTAKEKLQAHVNDPEELTAWIDQCAEFLTGKVEDFVKSSDSPVVQAFWKLISGLSVPLQTAVKSLIWKVVVRLVGTPDPKVDSQEAFHHILERLKAFSEKEIRPLSQAMKEGFQERSEQERLEKARVLTMPLLALIKEEIGALLPLPDWMINKLLDAANDWAAGQWVQSTQYSLAHPEEPEWADAFLLIQEAQEKARRNQAEGMASLQEKIDPAEPFVALIEKMVKTASTLVLPVQNVWMEPIHAVIEGYLWQLVSRLIPPVDDGQKIPLGQVLPMIMARVEAIGDRELPLLIASVQEGFADLSPEERMKRITDHSKPLIGKFLAQWDLPLPAPLRNHVIELVESQIAVAVGPHLTRYVEQALQPQAIEPMMFSFYEKYRGFLPQEMQEAFNPLMAGSLEHPEAISKARRKLQKKVDQPAALMDFVDQLMGKGVGIASDRIFASIAESFRLEKSLPLFEPVQKALDTWMKGWMWKIFINLIPKPPAGKTFTSEEVFSRVLDHLIQFSKEHFPEIMERMQLEWPDLTKQERKAHAAEMTKPVVKALLKEFAGKDLSQEIPLPEPYKSQAIAQVEEKLNEFLSSGLVETCGWLLNREKNEERVDELFKKHGEEPEHPSAPVKACHAAGKIIEAAVPYLCRENRQEWSDKAYQAFVALMPRGAQGANAALTGKKMVDSLLAYVGQVRSPEVKALMGFINAYAESALLKLTRKIGEKVQRLDHALGAGDASALERALNLMMKEFEPHLQVYGNGVRLFKKVDQKQMREQFAKAGLLHRAMESDESRARVFEKWSGQFLSIAGLEPGGKLPVPALLNPLAWQTLQLHLLPALMVVAFEKLKEGQTIDQVVRIGLEKLSSDWNRHKKPIDHIREAFFPAATADYKPHQPVIRPFDDPYQQNLERKIGRLGQLALRLHSTPVVGAVLRNKNVQAMVGQVIGQPLRGNLRDNGADPAKPGAAVPLNEVISMGLEAFVDHFVPCEKKEGVWKYFAHDEQGIASHHQLDEPDFSEFFPKNSKEKEKAEKNEELRRQVLKKEVAKGISRVIRDQLNLQIQSFANLPWDRLVDRFVKMLRAISRAKHKDKVELAVRKFFWFLRRYVVFPVLAFITLPIWLPVREVVSQILAKKSKKHIEGMKDNIHLNLAYRVMDKLLATLQGEKRKRKAAAA